MADAINGTDENKGRYAFAALLDGPDGADVKAWLLSRVPGAVDVATVDVRQHCFIEGQRSLIQILSKITQKETSSNA